MEVICEGHKTCSHSEWCTHSKPHQFRELGDNHCYNDDAIHTYVENCECNNNHIRKIKLEKLNGSNL